MKHGDQAKAKSAKVKASGSKNAVEGVEDSSHGDESAASRKAAGKAGSKAGGGKAAESGKEAGRSASSKGSARTRAAAPAEDVSFNNPAVGSAFERAIQTYPNAFRRLTD
jgi:hypothetical protein